MPMDKLHLVAAVILGAFLVAGLRYLVGKL